MDEIVVKDDDVISFTERSFSGAELINFMTVMSR